MQATATKQTALATFLECDQDELSESTHDDSLFEYGRMEYLVLTDGEADERTAEYIRNSLWAFNASFLVNFVPEGVDEDILQMIGEKCEDGNDAMLGLVGDNLEDLIEDAIRCDGRGHFLAGYDFEEIELSGDLYAYRTN